MSTHHHKSLCMLVWLRSSFSKPICTFFFLLYAYFFIKTKGKKKYTAYLNIRVLKKHRQVSTDKSLNYMLKWFRLCLFWGKIPLKVYATRFVGHQKWEVDCRFLPTFFNLNHNHDRIRGSNLVETNPNQVHKRLSLTSCMQLKFKCSLQPEILTESLFLVCE
jgi:hypothetical protein